MCSHATSITIKIYRAFPSPPKLPLRSISSSHPQALAITYLFPGPNSFAFSRTSRYYAFWNCAVCTLVCPASCIQRNVFDTNPCFNSLFLLMAAYTPRYEFTTICLSFHKLMSIWVVYDLGHLCIKLQCMFAYSSLCGCYVFNFVRNCFPKSW